jgi:hypothetical protein
MISAYVGNFFWIAFVGKVGHRQSVPGVCGVCVVVSRAVAVILLACGTYARAQGGPPMITDDPGTPGDGKWEINIAALTYRSTDVTLYQLPLVDLNYGVGDRLQLKYEVPWVLEKPFGVARSGLGNSLLGVKWRFYDPGESGWQISTYPQLQFNYPHGTSPQRGLADDGTRILIPFEFERNYGALDLTFEVGRWAAPVFRTDGWIAGIVLGHEIRKGLELMVELRDQGSANLARNESTANVGARWDISEHYTLLASAGRDLANGLGPKNTLLTYLGMQLRL